MVVALESFRPLNARSTVRGDSQPLVLGSTGRVLSQQGVRRFGALGLALSRLFERSTGDRHRALFADQAAGEAAARAITSALCAAAGAAAAAPPVSHQALQHDWTDCWAEGASNVVAGAAPKFDLPDNLRPLVRGLADSLLPIALCSLACLDLASAKYIWSRSRSGFDGVEAYYSAATGVAAELAAVVSAAAQLQDPLDAAMPVVARRSALNGPAFAFGPLRAMFTARTCLARLIRAFGDETVRACPLPPMLATVVSGMLSGSPSAVLAPIAPLVAAEADPASASAGGALVADAVESAARAATDFTGRPPSVAGLRLADTSGRLGGAELPT